MPRSSRTGSTESRSCRAPVVVTTFATFESPGHIMTWTLLIAGNHCIPINPDTSAMSGSSSRSTCRARASTISETYARSSFDQIIPLRMVYFYRDTSVTCESANASVSVGRGGVQSDPQRLLVRAASRKRARHVALSPRARAPVDWTAYSSFMVAERG